MEKIFREAETETNYLLPGLGGRDSFKQEGDIILGPIYTKTSTELDEAEFQTEVHSHYRRISYFS